MRMMGIGLLLGGILILGSAYFVFGNPLRTRHGTTLRVGPATFTVRIADTPMLQAKGLGGTLTLTDSEGMLFVFPSTARHSFWMQGMTIGLDFLWITDGKVVGITPDVPAPENPSSPFLPFYRPPSPVSWVLEIPQGAAARLGIAVGDSVALE
jgi:uncharacterized membrane protein (UPF0127 family)